MELRLAHLLEAMSYSCRKLANALNGDSVWRPWPSLVLLLIGWPLPAQDSARYQIDWLSPGVDPQHPAATLYHWQLVLGDTTPKQALGGTKVGVIFGYVNVYGNNRYGYPGLPQAVVTVARPALDSLGPFWLAVQPAYKLPDSTLVLGPYTLTAPWWVKPRSAGSDPPLLPNPILGYTMKEVPWP